MKKILILAVAAYAAMLTATAAEDSYLYWQVDVSGDTSYSFNYATIREANSQSYLSLYSSASDASMGTQLYTDGYGVDGNYAVGTKAGPTYAGLASYGIGSSFVVELWAEGSSKSDTSLVGWSYLSYADVLDSIYKPMSTTTLSPYTITASQLVPEPTSGLLALLGFAALALRRKQKKS